MSAVIICKDERVLIAECLKSLSFCSEIVVVDSGSTDGTLEIIKQFEEDGYPIRLAHHDWAGFAAQKAFALQQATMPWSLVIDADEQVDDRLRDSITAITTDTSSDHNGWRVRRSDWLAGYGQAHRLVLHNRILRLFRSDKVTVDPRSTIHETFIVDGPTGLIRSGLLIHMRKLSLEDEIARADSYATQKSEMRMAQGARPSVFKLVLSPPYTFIKFYFLKRYFLCGTAGFNYAMLMMLYSFLTEAKLARLSQHQKD